MINGVWQDNPQVDLSHLLYVSMRESLSTNEFNAADNGIKAEMVPDLMLMHEYPVGRGGGTVISNSVVDKSRGMHVSERNLPAFYDADRMVCGRFHADCLAIATGKPFSAYPSNTHKTKGMMIDAGIAQHYYDRADTAIAEVPTQLEHSQDKYLLGARDRIQTMIETVRELIKQACA